MRISSFNINKFCGLYSGTKGAYYNPRNIDFITPIKDIISKVLKTKDDIIFLQEFYDNKNIKAEEFFENNGYVVFHNSKLKSNIKSHVVAITLKDSIWELINPDSDDKLKNKFVAMKYNESLKIISIHNTGDTIKQMVNKEFKQHKKQVILGDFNDSSWIEELHNNKKLEYRDLVTDDMITFKPAQSTIDRIFVAKEYDSRKIVFNGILETFTSDHNILTFTLNI